MTASRSQRTRHAGRAGRGVAALLADFGHDLPTRPTSASPGREGSLFTEAVPRRGRAARAAGWAPAVAPLAMWRMSSDQTPVLWPLIAASGLPPAGAQMGIDLLSGGAFYCDPVGWITDEDIAVSNPNVFVFGKPGRGKSATVKVLCLRMIDFGYRVLILGDPKDEYEGLCRALGVEPFALGHGLPARINPLALGPLAYDWGRLDTREVQRRSAIIFARWLVLLRALIGSQKIGDHPVPVSPTDEQAISVALRDLTGHTTGTTQLREITVPQLWHALADPSPDLVTACRYPDRQAFLDATRLITDALGQLVHGHLAGLFDAPTTIEVDWRAPIQSLSLSRLEPLGDTATGIALLCLNSWGQAMREIADPGDLRIVVRDETWKQMRLGVEAVKALDANLRLSRRDGDVQVVIYHKPSDSLSAGAAGSQAVTIAKDLLHLGDVKVLHGQDQAVADELAGLLGIAPMAQRLVTGWAMAGQGRALWLVGERAFKVQTVLTALETELTFTNDALRNG